MARSKYGRPMKGATRRVQTTVQISTGVLDIIDTYVEEKDTAMDGAYSRSDFVNEALAVYMKQLGLVSDEQGVTKS